MPKVNSRACRQWKAAPGYEGYDKTPCAACDEWKGTCCNDIERAMAAHKDSMYEDVRETERLMAHDAFRRANGGIRQIRRGS